MSRKSIIMIGMIVGSTAGGWVPTLFGAGAISFTSIIGGLVGGILGIWLAFKVSG
jgi:hypothetical protein